MNKKSSTFPFENIIKDNLLITATVSESCPLKKSLAY